MTVLEADGGPLKTEYDSAMAVDVGFTDIVLSISLGELDISVVISYSGPMR